MSTTQDSNRRRRRLRWGPRGTAEATIAAHVALEHVGCRFGNIPAVDDVSIEVAPAEILCLLGPSGCGKTTLLRLTAGLERPDEGVIRINDREVSGPNVLVPPENRGIGLMFQDFALFPHLSLLENVAFGLRALPRADAVRVARGALERVGLSGYADEYPHILSGGEQQRVALARAIAPRPGVLLMDEPFSGLDSRLRMEMREETLTILKETRTTCMVVTHSPEEAMRMGNRIALMRSGRLIQAGTAEEIYREPADIGAARIFSDLNEIPCTVKGGRVETPLGRFDANGLANGEKAILCVRQGAVDIVKPSQGRDGRVLHSRFLGESALLEIGITGLDDPIRARVHESKAIPVGSEVGVKVSREGVLLFAETEPRATESGDRIGPERDRTGS